VQAWPPNRTRNVDDQLGRRRPSLRRPRRPQQRNDNVPAAAVREPRHAEHEQHPEQYDPEEQASLRRR
jgi:hypothetical protein